MQYLWIVYIFVYSFLKGSRDGMKKAALKKSTSDEILFFYSLIGFILIIPFSQNALTTPPIFIFYSFIKAMVVCSAWIFAYIALKNMSVSLFGIIDLSRMIFSTLLGVVVLGESMTVWKAVGVILVIIGLMLVNRKADSPSGKARVSIVAAALISMGFTYLLIIADSPRSSPSSA